MIDCHHAANPNRVAIFILLFKTAFLFSQDGSTSSLSAYEGLLRKSNSDLHNRLGDAAASAYHNKWVSQIYLGYPADAIISSIQESVGYCMPCQCETLLSMRKFGVLPFERLMDSSSFVVFQSLKLQCDTIAEKIDRVMVGKIQRLDSLDQLIRPQLNIKGIPNSESVLWEKQVQIDKKNQRELLLILDSVGYPGRSVVGELLSLVPLRIVLHADLDFQKSVLDHLVRAVEKKELCITAFVALVDKMLVLEKKEQLYGTQAIWSAKLNELVIAPILDIESIEIRRERVGLDSLSDYMERLAVKRIGKYYK